MAISPIPGGTNFLTQTPSLGPPDLTGGFGLGQAIDLINNLRNQQFNRQQMLIAQERQRQTAMQNMAVAAAQNNQNRPTNTVFGGTIPSAFPIQGAGMGGDIASTLAAVTDPTQRAKLQQAQEKIQQTGEIAGKKQTLGEQTLEQRGQIAKGKQDISQQRADVYQYKAENPNMVLVKPKGGNYQAFDPASGDMREIQGADGNPIPVGTLSDRDEANLKMQNAETLIGARSQAALTLQGVKGTQATQQIQERGAQARQTQAAAAGEKPYVASQRIINAHQYLMQHPEITDVSFDSTTGMPVLGKNVTPEQRAGLATAMGATPTDVGPAFTGPSYGGNIQSITQVPAGSSIQPGGGGGQEPEPEEPDEDTGNGGQ
jgi:hypothetical protein